MGIIKIFGLTKMKAVRGMLEVWYKKYQDKFTAKEFFRMCSLFKEEKGFSILYKGPKSKGK